MLTFWKQNRIDNVKITPLRLVMCNFCTHQSICNSMSIPIFFFFFFQFKDGSTISNIIPYKHLWIYCIIRGNNVCIMSAHEYFPDYDTTCLPKIFKIHFFLKTQCREWQFSILGIMCLTINREEYFSCSCFQLAVNWSRLNLVIQLYTNITLYMYTYLPHPQRLSLLSPMPGHTLSAHPRPGRRRRIFFCSQKTAQLCGCEWLGLNHRPPVSVGRSLAPQG